jgi:hypothetical protein
MATSTPSLPPIFPPVSARTPPKYVPTLTQVVPAEQLPRAVPVTQPPAPASVPASASVPLSAPAPAIQAVAPASPVSPTSVAQLSAEQSLDLADKLHRELIAHARKHVDAQLQRRVREAVSSLALAHTQDMLKALQPVIENTVAQVVDEAVGQALGQVLAKR